jgi:hypothetical protein
VDPTNHFIFNTTGKQEEKMVGERSFYCFVIIALGVTLGRSQQSSTIPPLAVQTEIKETPTIVLPNDFALSTDTAGYGATRDSVQSVLGDIPSLQQICSLSVVSLQEVNRYKDEHRINRYDTVPLDTSFQLELRVYEMIMAYNRLLTFGIPLSGKMPNLVRTRAVTDSISQLVLPKKPGNGTLHDGRYFFLGAGPFLTKKDDSLYKDQKGRAEIRYTCNINENTDYVFRMIRRFAHVRIDVALGPPCGSYDAGPQAVRGIGSLTHILRDRIPVNFITKQGIVRAELVSIKKKLFREDLGCVSDLPEIEFACSSIPKDEILGIYIPYDPVNFEKCMVKRKGKLWTADLDGDMIPDLAGVSHTFFGVSSDTKANIIWYVNIDGKWKVIDTAKELDCS